MKRVLFLFCLLFLVTSLSAQKVLYVSSNGSDTWSGSRTQPYQTVHKALQQSGVTEIRVAVGNYKISVYDQGQILIPAGVAVKGGYSEKAPHEVQDVLVEDRSVVSGQSVFQGDSTCRIFEVAGVLEQVTVTGGRAEGGNGGGVYVKSGGVMKNCIVWGNQAAGEAPKVGDLLMKNGVCMDVSLFTYDQKDDVDGIVFWVNPQRDAPKGERGRAMSIKTLNDYWMKHKNYTGNKAIDIADDVAFPEFAPYFLSESVALTDLEGEANTDKILAISSDFEFPLIKACRNMGAKWYTPAIGEIMFLTAEWSVVDDVLEILWNRVQTGSGGSRTVMQNYFGCTSANALKPWRLCGSIMFSAGSNIISSSCQTGSTVWAVRSFTNIEALSNAPIYRKTSGTKYTFTKYNTFAVRKF